MSEYGVGFPQCRKLGLQEALCSPRPHNRGDAKTEASIYASDACRAPGLTARAFPATVGRHRRPRRAPSGLLHSRSALPRGLRPSGASCRERREVAGEGPLPSIVPPGPFLPLAGWRKGKWPSGKVAVLVALLLQKRWLQRTPACHTSRLLKFQSPARVSPG